MCSFYEKCLTDVYSYTDALVTAIKSKKMSEGRFDGIMQSYLEAPAFYPEWRKLLLQLCIERKDLALGGPQLLRECPELYNELKEVL